MRVLANAGRRRRIPGFPMCLRSGTRLEDVEFYIWAGLFAQSAAGAGR